MMIHVRSISVILLSLSLNTGCSLYDETELQIIRPKVGEHLPANVPVQLIVSSSSDRLDSLRIRGVELIGERSQEAGRMTQSLSAIDGLGFVSVGHPGDPYVVTRSWLQGDFIPSDAWYPETIKVRLGSQILNGDSNSISKLIEYTLSLIHI